ncbi:MAG: T9SS type A sorting domain-containing protein [Bacteroidota bacterium]|nr:T9SS type A sorting domain-containing protein [Bacteroidota bacterium]
MNKKISALICATTLLFSSTILGQAQPVLMGTCSAGGSNSAGTIFYLNTGSSTINQTTSAPGGVNGSVLNGSIVKAANGKFYGMTSAGGANTYGCIYEVGYTGPYTVKYSFLTADGIQPDGALCQANDGLMYGLLRQGGANGYGVLFKYTPGSGTITPMRHFSAPDGSYPSGSLIQGSNNKLYGMTSSSGAYGYGTLFSFDPSTTTYTVLHDFNLTPDGGTPTGSLFEAANGKLYGMTSSGGANNNGTIFEYNIGLTQFTKLHDFSGSGTGANPQGDLIETSAGLLYGMTMNGGIYGYGCIFEYNIGSTVTTNKFNFQNAIADGGTPEGTLLKASNGLLYGVTSAGGANSTGTLFEFNPAGSVYTKKIDFTGAVGGASPMFVKLMEYMPLDASISSNSVLCNGMCNGSATVTPSGGTPPYTYSWAPIGGTAATATGLCAGTYTCVITEASGFQVTKITSVTQPSLLVNTTNVTNATCFGLANGTATITPSGGTGGYTFNWSPGGMTSAMVAGLSAPTIYTTTVTDANGCTSNNIANITQPTAITSGLTTSSVTCNGGNDGFATVSPSGGTPSYSYNWAPVGGTSASTSGLSAGNHTCTITDVNGCTLNEIVTISQPSAVGVSLIPTDLTCTGNMSGAITATGSGGLGGYSFLWSPGGMATATITGLNAGTYTCNIMDVNGCTSNSSTTLIEPSNIITSPTGTDPTCNGGSDGTATNNPSGGTPPYTYSWTPSGQTTQTAVGLSVGNHTVTITDANGCVVSDFSTLGEPALLTVSVSQTITGCSGTSSNEITANPSGGTAPYFYVWNDVSTGESLINVPSGLYYCTIADVNGCAASDTVIAIENPSTDVSGAITASTLNTNNGFVYAFKQQLSTNGIDTVAITPIVPGAPNTYTFTGLQADNYFIKVVPDATTFPTAVPTYFGNEFQWDSSTVVIHGCSVTDNADINVIELNGGSGTGFISGFVIEGNGFIGLRIKSNGGNPNMPFAPGGPLKGVDIKLGKNPGGGIQARTTSDSTGYYDFKDIPDGDYTVYVDIPNLPMDSTRTVNIAGADTSIQNNYYADSLMIFIDTAQSIGIYSSEKVYENKFNVYPNPAKDLLNLKFSITEKASDVAFEISDAAGKVVYATREEKYKQGDHTYTLNTSAINLKPGVYFMSIINDTKRYTQRLVVVE